MGRNVMQKKGGGTNEIINSLGSGVRKKWRDAKASIFKLEIILKSQSQLF